VNNAAIAGANVNYEILTTAVEKASDWPAGEEVWNEIITSETYDMVQDCLKTNYYGMKAMVEALLPLLNLSDSARIVNVSSFLGVLEVNFYYHVTELATTIVHRLGALYR
ncbi:hypothetical protein Gotri_021012, partial [Gossypium trilobum]|nr:hypothetical protein [Gossypium trilobum]